MTFLVKYAKFNLVGITQKEKIMDSVQIAYAKRIVIGFATHSAYTEIDAMITQLRDNGVDESTITEIESVKLLPMIAKKI